MANLTLDQKMEIAYGVKLHSLEEVVASLQAVPPAPQVPFRQRLINAVAFWRDDMAIMLLVASLAIMVASTPWIPFSLVKVLGWFIGYMMIFIPVALVFTWLVMAGFYQRRWTFVRVFSTSFFLSLAFLCFMATYFP